MRQRTPIFDETAILGDHTPEPVPLEETVAPESRNPRRRFNLRGRTLRQHAARGVMINTGFSIALGALGLVRGFALAAFLTQEDYGVWGTVILTISMFLLVKQVGIGDKYLQQDEADQELAFQRAWTLEAMLTGLGMLLVTLAAPIIALAYGEWKLLLPILAFVAVMPSGLLQMPMYVYYRRMQFFRQSVLQAIEPVTVTVVSLALAILGAGYWSLFIGLLVAGYATGAAAMLNAPYPLRWRYDRGTLRSYWAFSWPLFVSASGGVVVAFTAIVAANIKLGLAGAGALTLAANVTAFTQRVDNLVTGTMYPAICAVKDRLDLMTESFVKVNRLGLIWAMPFGFGLSLFAADFVQFVLGERWASVTGLLQIYGIVAAIGQIGFNWDAYFRALGDTRPMAVTASVATVVFLLVAIPLMFLGGLTAFAVGVGAMMLADVGCRAYYLRRLFRGFAFLGHALRAIFPVLPAVAVVLAIRLAETGDRAPLEAAAEFVTFVVLVLVATWLFERPLLREALAYVRARPATT